MASGILLALQCTAPERLPDEVHGHRWNVSHIR